MKITLEFEGADQNEIVEAIEKKLEEIKGMTPAAFNLIGNEITKPMATPLK